MRVLNGDGCLVSHYGQKTQIVVSNHRTVPGIADIENTGYPLAYYYRHGSESGLIMSLHLDALLRQVSGNVIGDKGFTGVSYLSGDPLPP